MKLLIDSYTGQSSRNISATGTTHPSALDNQRDFWSVASIVFFKDEDVKLNNREIRLLEEYKQIGDNWDLDGAKAPDASALCLAEYIVKAMEKTGQKVYHVAPGPRGEIMVDIRNNNTDKSLELLFYPNSNNKYVFFSTAEQPQQGNFLFSSLPELLNRLNA